MMPRRGAAARVSRIALLTCLAVGLIICVSTFLHFLAQGFVAWDAPTYLAAGERLNAGHDLYALVASDRPVLLNPPYWTVPLLSPPPIAVLWRPLALFGNAGMLVWWLACMASIGATVTAMSLRSPWIAGPALLVLSVPLAWELAAANVNGLLFGGFVGAWLLARTGHDRAAGILIGLMASVKVWPAILLIWFIAQGRRSALAAFVLVIAAVGLASLLFAGLPANLEYLRIGAAIRPSPNSLAGVLLSVGLDVPWIGYALGLLAVVAMVRYRRYQEATYALGIVTIVAASPVIYLNGFALLFTALAPFVWPLRGRRWRWQRHGRPRGQRADVADGDLPARA